MLKSHNHSKHGGFTYIQYIHIHTVYPVFDCGYQSYHIYEENYSKKKNSLTGKILQHFSCFASAISDILCIIDQHLNISTLQFFEQSSAV